MCTVFPTNKQNHPRAIHPNETVGAVPACPPERRRSGVSIPKTHGIMCGNERWMRPYGATRVGTQAPPLPRSVIFFHAIPHKQNNHLHAIHTNETNPPTHHPHKRNRRGGACVPARTSAQRRFHAKNTRIVRGDFNDGCALMGRHGRAHRLRPYPSLPNPTWCAPYPIGVILSIAQGWQVQRSLPWVTEAGEGATHNVGCTFFRPRGVTMFHTSSTQTKCVNNLTQQSGAEMHRALPPPQL